MHILTDVFHYQSLDIDMKTSLASIDDDQTHVHDLRVGSFGIFIPHSR